MALALALNLLVQEPLYSTACLTEVAALSGERLTDGNRARAYEKARQLERSTLRLAYALGQHNAALDASVVAMERSVAEGRSTPAELVNLRREVAGEKAANAATLEAMRLELPACGFLEPQ